MKALSFLVAALFSAAAFAQNNLQYFNYNWEPIDPNHARYVSTVVATDSGYQKVTYFLREKSLQFQGLFDDANCTFANGQFYWFHPNKKIKTIGKYVNGKKEGLWLSYHENGMMSDSAFYVKDLKTGVSMSWHANGYSKDSCSVLEDGRTIQFGWFDNGNISYAGYCDANGHKMGIWKYFHLNGQLSCKELFKQGEVADVEYYNEQGEVQPEGSVVNRNAEYPGGPKEWKKYVDKKCYFPSQYKIVNSDSAIVVVQFAINEQGYPDEIQVVSPFYPEFDRVAVDAIKKSKQWTPAIDHNRRVKFYQRFTLKFSQEE